jgi:hypothetical protein
MSMNGGAAGGEQFSRTVSNTNAGDLLMIWQGIVHCRLLYVQLHAVVFYRITAVPQASARWPCQALHLMAAQQAVG